MPDIAKKGHIKDLRKAEEWGVHFHLYKLVNNVLMTPFVFIGIAGMYYIFYHFEFPFIEQYKANSMPWPWYEMG